MKATIARSELFKAMNLLTVSAESKTAGLVAQAIAKANSYDPDTETFRIHLCEESLAWLRDRGVTVKTDSRKV
jgi:hypothetical protein